MPLIMLGVIILIIAFIIVPLIILLFTNPLIFGGGLIVLGLLWIIIPKIFYGLFFCIFRLYNYFMNDVRPYIVKKDWWIGTSKFLGYTMRIIDNDTTGRVIIYGGIACLIIIYIYVGITELSN